MPHPVCYFDLETTGVDKTKDRIVEIAIIKITDGVEEEFHSLVNPEIPIPPEASAVHGITDEAVANAPKLIEIAPKIIQLISGSDLAGFNSNSFDIPLLINELSRVGQTVELRDAVFYDAFKIYIRKETRTLTDAVKFYLGKDHTGAHGALADVRATMEVFHAQTERYDDLPKTRTELALYCNNDRKRADLSGRFAIDNDGDYVFAFGAHKNKKAKDERDYLKWMLSRDFNADTKELIRFILKDTPPTNI